MRIGNRDFFSYYTWCSRNWLLSPLTNVVIVFFHTWDQCKIRRWMNLKQEIFNKYRVWRKKTTTPIEWMQFKLFPKMVFGVKQKLTRSKNWLFFEATPALGSINGPGQRKSGNVEKNPRFLKKTDLSMGLIIVHHSIILFFGLNNQCRLWGWYKSFFFLNLIIIRFFGLQIIADSDSVIGMWEPGRAGLAWGDQ